MDDTQLRTLFANDAFAAACGLVIDAAGAGTATCSVLLGTAHRNGLGSAQGGLIYTLADFAFAVAANSAAPGTVTLNSTIHYLKAPRQGRLVATAAPEAPGKRTAVYRVQVHCQGELVAVATFTGYVTGGGKAKTAEQTP